MNTLTDQEPTRWWAEGHNAGLSQGPYDQPQNPYPPNTTEWWEWNAGYAAAQDE